MFITTETITGSIDGRFWDIWRDAEEENAPALPPATIANSAARTSGTLRTARQGWHARISTNAGNHWRAFLKM